MHHIEIPGRPLELTHTVFDGTLAVDGALIPDVDRLLASLVQIMPCWIATADTRGTGGR